MQKLVKNYLDEFNKRHKRNRRAIVALLLLAVLVIGGVLGTLSQYGVAMEEPEKKPLCGLEEHTHTEECYQDVLICGHGEEAEAEAAEPKQEQAAQEPAVQEQVEKVLSCGQEEQEGHQHSESCYETKSELTCGREESEGHTHTEACYGEDGALICELAESEGHTHSDGCYTEEEVLVCGQEEGDGAHTHTEACYTETISAAPVETTPAEQESSEEAAEKHTHTEACYERRLVCGLEEHTHTEACYIDGAADVETASDWEEMFADVEWKEQWGEDLVTAAQMQIGYQESQANYQSEEDGTRKGYTRYGAFMEDPYMDWNAAFVNFCLYYAGLCEEDVFPEDTNAGEWYQTFVEADENNADYITLPEEYEPKAGDIVFLKDEENGETLMGIVSSYDEETGEAKVIAGDDGDEVTEETYVVKGEAADESPISSYLMTTELEDHIKNNTRIMKAEGEDYTVTVRFTDAAEIPEDAVLNVREIEKDSERYQECYEQSLEAMEAEELSFARYFDITFLVNGEEIEPKDTVNVTINCADSIEAGEDDKLGAVHFKNDGEIEVLDVESNLNGGTAVASEEEVGSNPEEETTGTFFRFDQNSFSEVGAVVASGDGQPDESVHDFYKTDINELSELDGKTFLLTNFAENKDGSDRSRVMTGDSLDNGKGMKGEDISSDTTELSKPLTDAWSFEEADGGYYLYNVGWKKYLNISSSGAELVKKKDNASQLQVELDEENPNVVISLTEDEDTFRLNNSGSATAFAAYSSGESTAATNEGITLFAENVERTIVLRPYNDNGASDQDTRYYPYRFVVNNQDTVFNNTTFRSISQTTNAETIWLPSDITRTTGFDITKESGGARSIKNYTGDNKTYRWKLKGWYNITKNKYYSVVDGPKAVPSEELADGKNVFYADWEAANYNIGQKSSSTLGTALDTKGYSFINTEMFDYNELVNITLYDKKYGGYGRYLEPNKSEKWVASLQGGAAMIFVNGAFGFNKAGRYNLGSSGEDAVYTQISAGSETEILNTLFDFAKTEEIPMGVTYLGKADGLFKYNDADRSYEYDSRKNAASFNQSEHRFYVYPKQQMTSKSGGGDNSDFLPLNADSTSYGDLNGQVNYWFGMKTEINYWLNNNSDPNPEDGEQINYNNNKPMVFEFSGDDDVWVFDETKDDKGNWGNKKLLLNLSSCHGVWNGTINFSTGTVNENGTENDESFFTAGEHKLTIYYLERGAAESNCRIYFNLVPSWDYKGEAMQKITVKKQWVDADGKIERDKGFDPESANIPEKLSVSLYEVDDENNKTGEKAVDTAVLNSDNDWTWTWYMPLDKKYTVEEEALDSHIMSEGYPSKNDTEKYSAWVEDSALKTGDIIVIGNGKGGGNNESDVKGKVLEVTSNGTISSAECDAVLSAKGNPDVLREDDIPDSQRWRVEVVESTESGHTQFKLESVATGKYLNIKSLNDGCQVVTGKDNGSTLYFDGTNGNLTGTSKNQLVVNEEGDFGLSTIDSTSGSTKFSRVHLYKYMENTYPVTDFTLRNEPLMAKLQIKKVNRASESDLALSGAEFELYRKENYPNGSAEKTITTGNGDKLGIADIGSLPIGTYYLKETKAPTGYALLTEPVVITVSKNINQNPAEGEAKVSVKVDIDFQMSNAWANDTGIANGKDETTGHLIYDAKTGIFTIIVPNVLLYELPSTGGMGTYWYTIGGTLLLIAAALVLYKRKYAGR